MKNNNMKYDEHEIENLYQQNLEHARELLSSLQVAEERKPNVRGLNRWVYEQTIRYCLHQELQSQGFSLKIEEQETLSGRKRLIYW